MVKVVAKYTAKKEAKLLLQQQKAQENGHDSSTRQSSSSSESKKRARNDKIEGTTPKKQILDFTTSTDDGFDVTTDAGNDFGANTGSADQLMDFSNDPEQLYLNFDNNQNDEDGEINFDD